MTDGAVHLEAIDLDQLAAKLGMPIYAYSSAAIVESYRSFATAVGEDVSICFAVKANGNLTILTQLAKLGCGMDIVSGGELERALAAGVSPLRIIFSGVGKTREEITQALDAGIHQFNVESASELDLIADVATGRSVRAPVALRVNPDVDALTHDKISTGRKGDKFGIDLDHAYELYARAAATASLNPVGLAVHIGSQIMDLEPYRRAYTRIAKLAQQLRAGGYPVRRLDLGGGLGISYGHATPPSLDSYASVIRDTVGGLCAELAVEPGRRLIGEAGILLAQVLHIKPTHDADIVVIDAAMNDLARPALYGSLHPVTMLRPRPGPARPCRIVGPVCESADAFGLYTHLPALLPGDRIAFLYAGAYGAAMASTYNARPLVPEVLVDGSRYAIIRRRQTVAEMMALEADPRWRDMKLSDRSDLGAISA
ncbi:diaminopimelate decarboxylase [Mesorhizobium sp.]|uniref:diaminopimelate decarboxylase n=1 Tax=Mesorhizobium sp. TaxID=1871066 RepID=UPI0025D77BA9|nr:diaminopimelate decarboxylase [Mesorhizobium sp.]